MAVQEQTTVGQALVANVNELMVLAEKGAWDEFNNRKTGLLDPKLGVRQEDIATYILQSGFLRQDTTPNGDHRDCAWSILGVLQSNEIDPNTCANIALTAEVAALTDPHIFAAGRAADLIRLWSRDELAKKSAPFFMAEFAKRAKTSKFNDGERGEKTWLEYYKEDIPELASVIEKLG